MFFRKFTRLAWFGLLGLILASVISAMASANSVTPSGVGITTRPITANDLKPSACAALNLSNIVVGSGRFNGSGNNDLILGSAGTDDIRGRGGTDCILGGGGDDDITGNGGSDVCIGGPGNDTFSKCETVIQ